MIEGCFIRSRTHRYGVVLHSVYETSSLSTVGFDLRKKKQSFLGLRKIPPHISLVEFPCFAYPLVI